MQALVFAYLFVLGASLGSFAGVLVDRIPHHRSVVWPRSQCGECGHVFDPSP